jgi:hypothetical protein
MARPIPDPPPVTIAIPPAPEGELLELIVGYFFVVLFSILN